MINQDVELQQIHDLLDQASRRAKSLSSARRSREKHNLEGAISDALRALYAMPLQRNVVPAESLKLPNVVAFQPR